MNFLFYRLRFHFRAEGPIYFPPGKSANVLRGAFGSIFRKIACNTRCRSARTCELKENCAYARIFEPVAAGSGPSGLADPPRPFVFRSRHLNGQTVPVGSFFHFDVHLFDIAHEESIAYFILTFAQLAREGLGPGRSKAALLRVENLDEEGFAAQKIFEEGSILVSSVIQPVSLRLGSLPEAPLRIRVKFLTPTELKAGHQLAERPEFGILLARIRDRIGTLGALYGEGPLEIDFAAFGQRAAEVQMTRCNLEQIAVSRQSTRTGQHHSLGGFTGEAEYAGSLTEFLPFLQAAQFTGVGRQTTWGKGEICVTPDFCMG